MPRDRTLYTSHSWFYFSQSGASSFISGQSESTWSLSWTDKIQRASSVNHNLKQIVRAQAAADLRTVTALDAEDWNKTNGIIYTLHTLLTNICLLTILLSDACSMLSPVPASNHPSSWHKHQLLDQERELILCQNIVNTRSTNTNTSSRPSLIRRTG